MPQVYMRTISPGSNTTTSWRAVQYSCMAASTDVTEGSQRDGRFPAVVARIGRTGADPGLGHPAVAVLGPRMAARGRRRQRAVLGDAGELDRHPRLEVDVE